MPISATPLPAAVVVAILRTARDDRPDPRLDGVLVAFRDQWTELARRRFANLGADLEDALQEALFKLTDVARLATLRDVDRVEAWGRSLFVRTALDVLKLEQPHVAGRALTHAERTSPDAVALVDLLPSTADGPEATVAQEERMRLVHECLAHVDVGRLKFVDQLSDLEIAARCGLSRDGVAGRLKRLRRQLRAVLDDAERIVEGGTR